MADGAGAGHRTCPRGLSERMAAAAHAIADERISQNNFTSVAPKSPRVRSACQPVLDRPVLTSDMKQKLAKERREERKRLESAAKETKFLEKEKKSKIHYDKQVEEKQRKLREQKEKDELRRTCAEVNRRRQLQEERVRYGASMYPTGERSKPSDYFKIRWPWEGAAILNLDNKTATKRFISNDKLEPGNTSLDRYIFVPSTSLYHSLIKKSTEKKNLHLRRDAKFPLSAQLEQPGKEEKICVRRLYGSLQGNTLVTRLFDPTQESAARSKSTTFLTTVPGKELAGINIRYLQHTKMALHNQSNNELKTAKTDSESRVQMPSSIKVQISPKDKTELPTQAGAKELPEVKLPPKAAMQAPTEVGMKAPPKTKTGVKVPLEVSTKAPPEAQVKVSPEAQVKDSAKANVQAYPKANMGTPSKTGAKALPEAAIETAPKTNVDAPMEAHKEAPRKVDVEAPRGAIVKVHPWAVVETVPKTNKAAPLNTDVKALSRTGTQAPPKTDLEAPPSAGGEALRNGDVEKPLRAKVKIPKRVCVVTSRESGMETPTKKVGDSSQNSFAKKCLSPNIPYYRWPSSASGCRPPSPINRQIPKNRSSASSPVTSKQLALSYEVIPVHSTLYMPNALITTAKKKKVAISKTTNRPESLGQKSVTGGDAKSTPGATNARAATKSVTEKRRLAQEQREKKEEAERIRKEMQDSIIQRMKEISKKTTKGLDRNLWMIQDQGRQQPKDIEMKKEPQDPEAREILAQKADDKGKTPDAAYKREKERERLTLQNLQERLERKKRVDEIMSRTRKSHTNPSKSSEASGDGTCQQANEEEGEEAEDQPLDEVVSSVILSSIDMSQKLRKKLNNVKKMSLSLTYLRASGSHIIKETQSFNSNIQKSKRILQALLTPAKGSGPAVKKMVSHSDKTLNSHETDHIVGAAKSPTNKPQDWICDKAVEIVGQVKPPVSDSKSPSDDQMKNAKDATTVPQSSEIRLEGTGQEKPVSAHREI